MRDDAGACQTVLAGGTILLRRPLNKLDNSRSRRCGLAKSSRSYGQREHYKETDTAYAESHANKVGGLRSGVTNNSPLISMCHENVYKAWGRHMKGVQLHEYRQLCRFRDLPSLLNVHIHTYMYCNSRACCHPPDRIIGTSHTRILHILLVHVLCISCSSTPTKTYSVTAGGESVRLRLPSEALSCLWLHMYWYRVKTRIREYDR